jgi:hypothetical protein
MSYFDKISQAMQLAKTMWYKPHPRISSNGSFTDGKFVESPDDKKAREAKNEFVKDLEALKAAGFTYVVICLADEDIVSVSFHKRAVGGYLFVNGSLLLTSQGLDKHHNGIVSAEKGVWVIAEFQDGAIDPEILEQFSDIDGWHVCIHHE